MRIVICINRDAEFDYFLRILTQNYIGTFEKCVGLWGIPDYSLKFSLYDAHWGRKFVSH